MSPGSTEKGAESDRRPTDRLDTFVIPSEHVPPGLAERAAAGVEGSATRPAATVVLARESSGGPEVLLLRRPGRSSFAANAWVFPGGRVDPADAQAGSMMLGPPSEEWGSLLGLAPEAAGAFVAAALREAWEETGILLSDPPVDRERARGARERLLAGETSLARELSLMDSRLDARGVAYIAHWITPEPEARRYDTRFFLAAVPEDSSCDLLGDELVAAGWMRPSEAVDAYGRGDLRLLPPTIHTLRRLADFTSLPAMMDTLRGSEVRSILPRMRHDPAGIVIEIPE